MKNKSAFALLASAALIAALATDASAAGRGGGGGHSGGGGGHPGGGGGGFHAGGGGFHAMGGGGFHPGGGGVRIGGGGGGFHPMGGGARMGAFHGGAPHFAGHQAAPHGFASQGPAHRFGNLGPERGFAHRGPGARGFAAHNAPTGHLAPQGGRTLGHANVQTGGNRNVTGIQQGRGERRLLGHAAAGAAGAALGAAAVTHAQFAHNQFAAHNFHGLTNFNRAGFNRNAFGDPQHWNRFGGQFWGAGWHRWGRGWGGWAGPVFWPYLYGDVFSFAFWPYDYYDPFWAYGPDYGYAPDYGYVPGATGYSGRAVYYGGAPAGQLNVTKEDREALGETEAAAVESCNSLAPGVTDLPIDKIKQTVQPSGDQLTALDELNAAALKARDAIKGACPTAVPLTPVARLEAAEARLEAVIKAVDIVHDPLQRFYDSLNPDQQRRFESMGSSGSSEKAPPGGNIAALCGQQSADVTDVPIQRIDQVVQPNGPQQQDALNALKQAARVAAQDLQASCPKEVPQTPVARLDAVKTRLAAMVEAMKTIRPKLQDFYNALSDEQKAKFNIMSPAQSASSGAPQQND
jgi:hypothetical protein